MRCSPGGESAGQGRTEYGYPYGYKRNANVRSWPPWRPVRLVSIWRHPTLDQVDRTVKRRRDVREDNEPGRG